MQSRTVPPRAAHARAGRTKRAQYKSWLSLWTPLGLRRIDWYYIKYYVRTLAIILFAIAALVAIGDMFQRFDEFVLLARKEDMDLWASVKLFLSYYGSWVPQLILQYMFPVTMLLAAAITITSSYSGPRGNNEYVVIRSAGVPVLRAFLPLLLPALLIAGAFQAGRDFFLPGMVRDSNAILNRLRSRVSNPTSFTHYGEHGIQTAAIGYFGPDGLAHNIILEVRDPATFQRGEPALGDNDFTAHRAAVARLEPAPDGAGYQWTPVEKGEAHTYTRFSRTSVPWTEPIRTGITPAMIERQPLGDAVSSWRDLFLMERDSPGAGFEIHWRLAEPVACLLLILWGAGLCMWRMLRGRVAGFIPSITVSMIAAALFYVLRLSGRTLWESGTLTPAEGVWLPLAAAALICLPVVYRLEP